MWYDISTLKGKVRWDGEGRGMERDGKESAGQGRTGQDRADKDWDREERGNVMAG